MAFRIGFAAEAADERGTEVCAPPERESAPRPSVVRVSFREPERELSYYNDRFDLHVGDLVFVEGKLAGVRGRVTEVNENFRIRLSDYKRVIAAADTDVHGRFWGAGSHFVTFERHALPAEKVSSWFFPPEDEAEIVSGTGGDSFPLDRLGEMRASGAVFARGEAYYEENRVRYFCLDGERGYAIVEGSRPYEVRFTYRGGTVGALTCSCFCSGICKHEAAAMLQVRETLEYVRAHAVGEYEDGGYIAAVFRGTLFAFAFDRGTAGIVL